MHVNPKYCTEGILNSNGSVDKKNKKKKKKKNINLKITRSSGKKMIFNLKGMDKMWYSSSTFFGSKIFGVTILRHQQVEA